ncbi:clarin-2-like [Daphnia magna]|uniref:clarin-2-like n=1 Tax=Daphnia magna TaxID=35525 RepID=UPI0014025A42|nr:clarin-2-like [Daphnia magna]
MNLYKRGLIFATFLGCSLSAAFLAASVSTDSWVYADVKRVTNPFESDGHVFFGLFKGKRELNVGYGWRTYPVSVTENLNGEFLNFGLWITTVTCVCVAIIFAIIGALMAIVNTTLTPVETIAGRIGLFIWNGLSVVFSLTAMIAWITQFYLRLSSNVLVQEDRDNHWTSEGRAYLGYSFWFVIGSALSHVANIVLLVLVNADERRKYVKPLPTEKTNSAVLLY